MDDSARLMRFILELRQQGVTDARVLAAMERTPRKHFAPAHLEDLALEDRPLPLAHSESMTKPSVVGRMLAALKAQPEQIVLEVGTGSGYQAAVLGSLALKVVTLERHIDLVASARARLGQARLLNVFPHLKDGSEGWPQSAPYDRIIVNAAVEEPPIALMSQLKPGGVLVAPIGGRLFQLCDGAREDFGPAVFGALAKGLPQQS